MSVILKKPAAEAYSILDTVWANGRLSRPIPVDPVIISRRLGIDVQEVELAADISGAIVNDNYGTRILLNIRDHPNRQRFSCAHELGHYVLHSDGPVDYGYVDYRDTKASTGTDQEEMFANQFAAALLIPKTELDEVRSDATLSTVSLAYIFRVSQEAMTNRLKNLGYLG